MTITRSELAHLVDHTLLSPTATDADVAALAAEAVRLGTYSICVSPAMLPVTAELGAVKVATVCGFPSGKHTASVKAAEAADSVARGADEVDMVIDLGLVKAGRLDATQAEIAAVRAAVPTPKVLKVIIESAALTDEEIVAACQAAESAGADFVKTSTGFGPGGATVQDVALMRRVVGPDIGVKASGGVRNYADTQAMIAAGATRIGASAGVAIVSEARR